MEERELESKNTPEGLHMTKAHHRGVDQYQGEGQRSGKRREVGSQDGTKEGLCGRGEVAGGRADELEGGGMTGEHQEEEKPQTTQRVKAPTPEEKSDLRRVREGGAEEEGTAEKEGAAMGRFNDNGKFEAERRDEGGSSPSSPEEGSRERSVEEEEDDEEDDEEGTIRDSRGKSQEPSGDRAGRGRDWSAERRRGTKVSLFPEELWPRALRACFKAVLDMASRETRSTDTFEEMKEGFNGSSEEGGVEERSDGVGGRDIGKGKREGGLG
ncbi:hypothetical protein BC829DRAFT_422077 [Chytridium lagenaria]|nr:hypothetical protein BC829DRAFT_422077 [Chytridium lagenaria]